jgi:hypothetical protein
MIGVDSPQQNNVPRTGLTFSPAKTFDLYAGLGDSNVGVSGDATSNYLFLKGMLGGSGGGTSTFVSRHWLCWTGGSGTGAYSNVKFSFTPPPSGGYSFIAAADTPTQNCQAHACYISSSGGEVTGYGQYGGYVFVSLFGWRRA